MDRCNDVELGNIVQDHNATNTPGLNTVLFLDHDAIKNIPACRKIAYVCIVEDYRQQKPNPNRVRITVGENLIEYPHEVETQTADLVPATILWNSVGSTPNAKYEKL